MHVTRRSTRAMLATLALSIGASIYAAPAAAGELPRTFHQGSAGNCHVTDSADEQYMARSESGYVNTRANNGNPKHNVEVVCNPVGDAYAVAVGDPQDTVGQLDFFARNTRNNRDVTLGCVLYAGYLDSPYARTELKTVILPKTGAVKPISYHAPDFDDFYPTPLSIVCDVPAGVELTDSVVIYLEDIGS